MRRQQNEGRGRAPARKRRCKANQREMPEREHRTPYHCKDENDRDRDPAGKGAMDASLQVERMDDALGNQIIEKEKHLL